MTSLTVSAPRWGQVPPSPKVIEAVSADPPQRSLAAGATVRTVWHSLCDQQADTLEVSFCLGEEVQADGTRHGRRSDYLTVALDAG